MALSSGTVFEVRPTAGNDSNGGGFVTGASGTDYSQQNSSQYSLTGLTTAGAAALIATTSASADMVGNLIHITAGTNFITGWYQILSVVVGVSITVDRNATTGVGAAGAGTIGGAFATVAQANSIAVASNVVYIKATGTYTVTTALTITLDSHLAPATPYSFIGYTSTRGDGGQVTWTTSTNSIDLVDMNGSQNVLFQNIIFSNTAGTPGAGLLSGKTGAPQALTTTIINCKFSGFTVGLEGNFTVGQSFVGLYVYNSRFTGMTSHGIRNAGSTFMLGVLSDNNGGDGFNSATTAPLSTTQWYVFENCIFYKNSANGIKMDYTNAGGSAISMLILNNCAVSTNTGAGVLMGNALDPYAQFCNSIFDANGTYGIDAGSGTVMISALVYNNAFFNNTTGATRNINTGMGTITLSASPYTSLGSLNFALNSTAGGGAALKAAGFPGVLQVGGTGNADVGPLQSSGTTTTTTYVINQNVTRHVTEEA